jgi:hypothetical protein
MKVDQLNMVLREADSASGFPWAGNAAEALRLSLFTIKSTNCQSQKTWFNAAHGHIEDFMNSGELKGRGHVHASK